jgi:hypothetical protein
LELIDLPELYHGEIMNTCFDFIQDPATPAAIKAFSLTILDRLSVTYPAIKPELRLIIEERWDTETAAFRSRGRKILKSQKSNIKAVIVLMRIKINNTLQAACSL